MKQLNNLKLLCIEQMPNKTMGTSDVRVGELYTATAEIADMYKICTVYGFEGFFPKSCFRRVEDVQFADMLVDIDLQMWDLITIAQIQNNETLAQKLIDLKQAIADLSVD